MCIEIETVMSETERDAKADVFRTGYTAHKISNNLQVSNGSMQCCRVSLEVSRLLASMSKLPESQALFAEKCFSN